MLLLSMSVKQVSIPRHQNGRLWSTAPLECPGLDSCLASALGLLIHVLLEFIMLGRESGCSEEVVAQSEKKKKKNKECLVSTWSILKGNQSKKWSYLFRYLRTVSSASFASTTGMVVLSARRQILWSGMYAKEKQDLDERDDLSFHSSSG